MRTLTPCADLRSGTKAISLRPSRQRRRGCVLAATYADVRGGKYSPKDADAGILEDERAGLRFPSHFRVRNVHKLEERCG